MTSVETVRGAAGTDTLGHVLMHEHVFILTSGINDNFPEISGWAEDGRVDEAIGPLERVPDVLRMPNWHYNHISKDAIPALQARGVTDDQRDEMLLDNPRRIFEAPRERY